MAHRGASVLSQPPVVVGVDAGGTKIAAGAVAADGQTFASHAVPTGAGDGTQAVVDRITGLVQDTVREAREAGRRIAGVAAATPGMVDSRTGAVTFATPVLPAWAGVDLGGHIESATGLPARIANDAHAGAWGEWCCGAGCGTRHMVMVTVGTGVGGGGVADGDEGLVDAARQHMADRLPPALARGVSLRRGALGQRAAVAGAALLAWSHFTSGDLHPGERHP